MIEYETRWLAICNEAIRVEAQSKELLQEYCELRPAIITQMIQSGLIQKGMKK